MILTSPLFYVPCIMAALFLANSRLFIWADSTWHPSGSTTSISSFDGLRGFLATGVFFHHAVIYHAYLVQHVWKVPPSSFYTELGQAGVSCFFMITGFLFWKKAITGRINWIRFYQGRLLRIGPIFYCAMLMMLAVVGWNTHWSLNVSLREFGHELYPLLFLGWFHEPLVINGWHNPGMVLAEVTWTLRYEWNFYLIIFPLCYRLARTSHHTLFAALLWTVTSAFFCYRPNINHIALGLFATGMLTASLSCTNLLRTITQHRQFNRIASVLVLVLIAMILRRPTAYNAVSYLIMVPAFILLGLKADIFGILVLKPVRRLGDLSYGIYLLQGPVLYWGMHNSILHPLALSSVWGYWLVVFCEFLTLLVVALCAHRWLEVPAMRCNRYMENNRLGQ